jgi:high-affinity nickel-transport protein
LLSLLSLLAVGFFLGVRHATDADHVVAIATIVTRERRMSAAAAIGVLWGVGHGLTILLVGCLIILFGVVIPPRIGLAMEFAVGIMLTLLGVFTLAAVAKQAREALAVHLMHGHEGTTALLGDSRHQPTEGHTHVHLHGDYVHTHAHGHEHEGHGHDEQATPRPGSIGTSGGSASTRSCARSSWASCTASRGRRRWACWRWRRCATRPGASST